MLPDSPEASGPCKHKLSTKATTNGDPEMERKKKKLEAKKQSTKPALTKKHSSTRAPVNTTTKPTAKPAPVPWSQRPFIEVEEIEDESNRHTSVPPHNPQHILEAINGSDNDKEDLAPDGNEEGEAPEESNEAKLGM